ncbi:carboxylesterase/lipase family protein [Arthrobacter sp. ISL-28]|uniref:carboxylesterase/lipase family protein n=1 Tax=Arthrobacter sp. ISL-28 TaxID=2819108 RepID=UPI001BE564D2|nr:carboxylesterase family protein [Arthrobacter sp. ISL-28]MBT2523429.1 carboxylesterase family protein [Arthrobacter sp. ISL-28]
MSHHPDTTKNIKDAENTVITAQGAVRGLRHDGTTAFLNIPYAAAPLGAGRFQAPQPHAPWQDVRDATNPGPNAPQSERKLGHVDMSPYFGPGWIRGEDYLTVNVWTPQTDGKRLPVMVFVHGGGFVAGSTRSELYDGTGFARDGVVLVTLNYRLGIPGFLDLPGAPPNRGVLDVMAALRWVQENIAAFGGDPSSVTLFGQSAGATIVSAMLADPEAEGLFRRAIVQSGSGLGAFTPEQAARVTRAAAEALGVEPRVEAFAGIPDEDLVDIMPKLSGLDLRTETDGDPLIGLSPFSVVLDQQPAEAVAAGQGGAIDLLVGTNTEEGNLYLAPLGNLSTSTEADVDAAADRSHRDPVGLVETYRKARPQASFGELRSAIMGDALFGAGSWRLADAHAGHKASATYSYLFAWRSNSLGGELGATHAMELPFVFDITGLPQLHGREALLGPDEPPAELAARMHAAWVAFARTGDPGWDRYDTVRRATLRIDDGVWAVQDDPRSEERKAWR